MGVKVLTTEGEVRLIAPLGPNVNHRNTVFGGSLASVATLAAWSALRVRLGDSARVVVVCQATDYLKPVSAEFEAIARLPEGPTLEAFLSAYSRRGKARIELDVVVLSEAQVVATLKGTFAALADGP